MSKSYKNRVKQKYTIFSIGGRYPSRDESGHGISPEMNELEPNKKSWKSELITLKNKKVRAI